MHLSSRCDILEPKILPTDSSQVLLVVMPLRKQLFPSIAFLSPDSIFKASGSSWDSDMSWPLPTGTLSVAFCSLTSIGPSGLSLVDLSSSSGPAHFLPPHPLG